MLRAVDPSSAAGFEGLNEKAYMARGFTPRAPSNNAAAIFRQALGSPTEALPGVPTPNNKIATSSARPGKQTNTKIVYTRVSSCFSRPNRHIIDPQEICEGDVVFVNRYDGVFQTGGDVSRPMRVATLRQLNRVLRDDPFATRAVVEAPMGTNVVDGTSGPNDIPRARWKSHPILAEWALDGIVAGTEHQHGGPMPLVGGANSEPGEAFNVCVGGPTLMRNSVEGEFPQHCDGGIRVLDRVYVGLVARNSYKIPSGGTLDDAVEHYLYEYKLFTGRQLMAVGWGSSSGGNGSNGLSLHDLLCMVDVWRVGSVVDSPGMLSYACANVNVVVEHVTMRQLREEYNNAILGQSLCREPISVDLKVEGYRTVAALVKEAVKVVEANAFKAVVLKAYNFAVKFQIDANEVEETADAWEELARRFEESRPADRVPDPRKSTSPIHMQYQVPGWSYRATFCGVITGMNTDGSNKIETMFEGDDLGELFKFVGLGPEAVAERRQELALVARVAAMAADPTFPNVSTDLNNVSNEHRRIVTLRSILEPALKMLNINLESGDLTRMEIDGRPKCPVPERPQRR